MKYLTTILLIIFTYPFLMAQQGEQEKKWNLEFGFSATMVGPVKQMDDLMIKHSFDATTYSWFSSRYIQHPHYDNVGVSYQLTFSKYINQRSQVGLQFTQSYLNEIFGYSSQAGYLFVQFSSTSIIPVYTYELNNFGELRLGPALLINRGRRTSSEYGMASEDYKKIAPGLLTEFSLKLWGGNIMYGKLSTSYLFSLPVQMGPFSTRGINDTIDEIPETRIGFGHLKVGLVFGFHPYRFN